MAYFIPLCFCGKYPCACTTVDHEERASTSGFTTLRIQDNTISVTAINGVAVSDPLVLTPIPTPEHDYSVQMLIDDDEIEVMEEEVQTEIEPEETELELMDVDEFMIEEYARWFKHGVTED